MISIASDVCESLLHQSDLHNVCSHHTARYFSLKSPEAKVLFGFPINMDTNSPEMLASKRFNMQGSYLIQMLDTALSMLGPDIELLTDILQDLGTKHVHYGVKPEMFYIMGEA